MFVEGGRLFTRNILVGGSTVTGNVAKELGTSFGEAEDRKRSQGFVSPGGSHEAHEDEVVDAISKIIRNTMTRLHGEVIRTINYYRSQQGGSPPAAHFPLRRRRADPVDRGVFRRKIRSAGRGAQSVARSAGRAAHPIAADSHAPAMGELVGLALRHAGGVPVEVELVPESVAQARDTARRAPLLILATLCLFAALGTGIFYFKKAAQVVRAKLGGALGPLRGPRQARQGNQETADATRRPQGQSAQLEDAVKSRGWWNHLLRDAEQQIRE